MTNSKRKKRIGRILSRGAALFVLGGVIQISGGLVDRSTVAAKVIPAAAGKSRPLNSAAVVSRQKFDEFTGAGWEDATARLDSFVVDLQNDPAALGIILVYGGQNRRRGEARAWSACLTDYLQHRRGIEPNRIVLIQGGYKSRLTVELWKSPDKTDLPKPNPEIKPGAVRFKGRPIRRWRTLCSL